MNPLALLLFTGSLIGLNFPLGKLALTAGVSPIVWSLLMSAGVALALGVVMVLRGLRLPITRRHLRYYLIAGIVSYALPNLLVLSVIPHLGAGFTSIMFTFSPIFTLALTSFVKTQRPNWLGVVGIGFGFAGALLIVMSKGQLSAPAEPFWIGVGFLIPLALACGNIYRTIDWPGETAGLALAVGTNAASALFLATASVLVHGGVPAAALASVPTVVVLQLVVSAAMFSLFFRLQRDGGPVYLSQIGYVAAAVGLATGSLFLGESYGLLTWLGAVVVAIGVLMTTRAQAR